MDLNIFLCDTMVPQETIYSSPGLGVPAFEQGQPKEIVYLIKDLESPNESYPFKWVLSTAIEAIREGKRVGVSCKSGHGRTGLFMALVWDALNPQDHDPIATIRHLVCDGMVESWDQVVFVHQYIGLEVPPLSERHKYFHYSAGGNPEEALDVESSDGGLASPEDLGQDEALRITTEADDRIEQGDPQEGPYVIVGENTVVPVYLSPDTDQYFIRFLCPSCYSGMGLWNEDKLKCLGCSAYHRNPKIGSANNGAGI